MSCACINQKKEDFQHVTMHKKKVITPQEWKQV